MTLKRVGDTDWPGGGAVPPNVIRWYGAWHAGAFSCNVGADLRVCPTVGYITLLQQRTHRSAPVKAIVILECETNKVKTDKPHRLLRSPLSQLGVGLGVGVLGAR